MSPWLLVVVSVCGLALLGEAAFRIMLRVRRIRFSPPKTYRDLYMVPHPYLPYVYKPDSVIANIHAAPYPLHLGRFEFRPVRVNNFRFMGEDVQVQKGTGTWRIMCLGGSTTANSLWEVGNSRQYSYPLCLKEILERSFGAGRFEVLNCGMGGWTSAEILVNFALHLIDLRPDVVVLYHGFNDLEASLTTPFRSDYAHSRKNLAQAFARIRLASYVPNFRHWKSYFFLKRKVLGFGNIRYDLLRSIRVKKPDFNNPFMGLETERRNVEHLIHLCRANRIPIILSTFAYRLYEGVSQDRRALKYQEGVGMENEMIRGLAKQYDLPFVDIAVLIPDEDAYFLDSMHFTPLGMGFLANMFADRIAEALMLRRRGGDPHTGVAATVSPVARNSRIS